MEIVKLTVSYLQELKTQDWKMSCFEKKNTLVKND